MKCSAPPGRQGKLRELRGRIEESRGALILSLTDIPRIPE